ncbi:hypothetical protein Pmani_006089 [Petrolisthes manimaculis]|uniref:Uncharacterized protein n=1 Tax=Petrolisthes manimaculis TaxID=1843537 RepID=A0AAE1ULJ3_9EUCA|nr:hypothetical protein Pmani_006089 [Petrolisthes manimaculis]
MDPLHHSASHTRDPSSYNVAEPNRRAREMEPAQSVTDPPHHAKIDVRINNVNMTALIDSGSTSSFLHPCVIKQLVSTSDLAPAPKELSTHNYSSLPPVTPPDVPSPSDDLPVAHGIEDSKHTPEKQDNLSYNPGVAHRPQDGEPLKPEDNLGLESLRRSSRGIGEIFSSPNAGTPLHATQHLLLETPYITNLSTLMAEALNRLVTVFNKQRHYLFTWAIETVILPVVVDAELEALTMSDLAVTWSALWHHFLFTVLGCQTFTHHNCQHLPCSCLGHKPVLC